MTNEAERAQWAATSSGYACHIGQLLRSRDLLRAGATREERDGVYAALADEVPTLIAIIERQRPVIEALARYGAALAAVRAMTGPELQVAGRDPRYTALHQAKVGLDHLALARTAPGSAPDDAAGRG